MSVNEGYVRVNVEVTEASAHAMKLKAAPGVGVQFKEVSIPRMLIPNADVCNKGDVGFVELPEWLATQAGMTK